MNRTPFWRFVLPQTTQLPDMKLKWSGVTVLPAKKYICLLTISYIS